MIELQYRSNTQQLIHAAYLYMQYSLSNIQWRLITILTAFGSLALLPYYWQGHYLNFYWVLAHIFLVIGVFGRYRLSKLLIRKGMHRDDLDNQTIHVEMTMDGIHYWSESAGLIDDSAKWEDIPLVMETANGYVIIAPCGRFIWIPFSAFADLHGHHAVRQLFNDKHIRVESHPEWSC